MPARWKPLELRWTGTDEIWNLTEGIWSEEVIKLWQGGSRGGVKKQWDTWKKFNKKERQSVIKIILQLKGVDFKQTKIVKDYKVTVEDIQLLMEAFEQSLKENNITVEDVEIIIKNKGAELCQVENLIIQENT